jgi:hypothetical protein
MFNKQALHNRFQNGCLAAIGTAPIVGLASYKVLEDLKLDRDLYKIAKFTLLASLVSGLVWSLFPSARRKPSEEEESAVKNSYSPVLLIQISESIKDAEDAYIMKLHRERQADKAAETSSAGVLEPRRSSSFPGYVRPGEITVERTETRTSGGYANPLRASSPFRSSTLSSGDRELSSVDISSVLLSDDPND